MKYAVKVGRLIRGICVVCGEEKTHGHHTDYTKPYDVVWLCRIHHELEHKKSSTYVEQALSGV